jgi:Mn2+/Fe2+ NRAMP family transporter
MSTATRPTVPEDPYRLTPEDVSEPPRTLGAILRRIGPGIILASSIVGTGELIATTRLGAQVGYTALWVILVSCFIKPVVQAEIGRFTVASGETGLASFNRFPGPRWKVNWIVWAWAVTVVCTLLQVGAMFGGVAQVFNQVAPAVPVNAWVLVFLVLTLGLLLGGGYQRIERLAMINVGLFTLLTFLSALLLVRVPQFFSLGELVEGLKFRLPGEGIATAAACFGITGVGATEMFMYPYWCVEKGYARFTGKDDGTARWQSRARGWVKVMHVDIFFSMLIYTLATVAFYVLGAGVLHGMRLMPESHRMIVELSNIYTRTLGGWSLPLFYAGAFACLYGVIFAATAAHSRVYADMVRLMGFFPASDYAVRVRWRKRFVWFLTVVPVVLYLVIQEPARMVVAGGIAQAMMLPIIGVGTLFLRHRLLPKKVAPSLATTALLWVAGVVMAAFAAYYLATRVL